MEDTKFHELCDSFRSPHLWIETNSGGSLDIQSIKMVIMINFRLIIKN